ncbi:MAG: C40 family peptidase [Chloroflexales bacterium]|nr:C40 family peptidase [Chloroflexales bacterium]
MLFSSTPPQVQAASQKIPSAFIGSWQGTGSQVNPSNTWTVLTTITGGQVGALIGIIAYPSLRCGGELRLRKINPDSIEVLEHITYGGCFDNGITTYKVANGQLIYTQYYTYRPTTATATQDRNNSIGTTIPEPYLGIWRGATNQGRNWTIDLALNNANKDIIAGTVAYPSLNCGGTLALASVTSALIVFSERITYGNCIDNLIVTLELSSTDTLQYVESDSSGHIFGSGPITNIGSEIDLPTLANQAAELAKTVVTAPYLWGGKGWDYVDNTFVDSQKIFAGYNYLSKQMSPGVDCSGLVFWSYNKAFGGSKVLEGNPIQYYGADGQYKNNTVAIAEADIIPGDLLFFDWDSDGVMDHVAMYVGDVGGNDVVNARDQNSGIIWSKKDDLKQLSGFRGFRRIKSPKVGIVIRTHSPVSLAVTDPSGNIISNTTVITTAEEHLTEIPGILYYVVDANLDDVVLSPILQVGTYKIKVEPKNGTKSTDTYSLEVISADKVVTLAQNVPIINIPPEGYVINSTGTTIDVPLRKVFVPMIRR